MKIICFLLLSTVLAGFAPAARAQDDPASRFMPALYRVLTPPQRQSLQRLMGAQRLQMRALQEKIRASRQALLDQITNGKFDEDAAKRCAAQSAQAEAALTVMFAKAISQMQPPLSAQQAAQLKNFHAARLREARKEKAADNADTAPEVHLKLPPPLPSDANGLPIMN